MFTKHYVLILALLSLTSCASLSEKGHRALNDGAYDQALAYFQRAVEESPNSSQAAADLLKGRQAWLSHQLIEVRLHRLGNNFGESERILQLLLRKQKNWGVAPPGVGFSTQQEEVQLLAARVNKRIDVYLSSSNPIAAQVELDRSQTIFEDVLTQNLAPLKSKTYVTAQKFCSRLEHSIKDNEYYTNDWLIRTCRVWGIKIKPRTLVNSVTLFSEVRPTFSIKSLPLEAVDYFTKSLGEAFAGTKWHDPNSLQVFSTQLVGSFETAQSEKDVRQEMDYTVQVPYEVSTRRVKAPNAQNASPGLVGNLVGGLFGLPLGWSERVVDNGDGTETVYTTAYRSEPRTHYYHAVEIRATKALGVEWKGRLGQKSFEASVRGQYLMNGERHSENFPDVGLVPSDPRVVSDLEWLKVMQSEWVARWRQQLQDHWTSTFCERKFKNTAGLSVREQIHRCAYKLEGPTPPAIEQAYLKEWKISFGDWSQAVAISRSEDESADLLK